MSLTPVYIICSPRPLVGKTLLARLLSEFLLLRDGTVSSFDINLKEPSLLEYLPRITETADIIDTFGKMQLMDRLIVNDGVAKVIDLGFHAFDEFFKMTNEIGFLKEATRRSVAPIILFVADTDRVSARAYPTLLEQIPLKSLITVDNEFVVRGELPEAMGLGRVLRITALPSFLKTYVDRPDLFLHRLPAQRAGPIDRVAPVGTEELHQLSGTRVQPASAAVVSPRDGCHP